jgi:hypothetical protein
LQLYWRYTFFSPVEGANDNISREDKGNEIEDAAALRKGETAVALSKWATTKEELCAGALSKGTLCAAAYRAVALSKGATTKEELRAGDVLSKGKYHAAEINETDVGWTPKKEKRNRTGISTTSGEPQCFGPNVTCNPATNQNFLEQKVRVHPTTKARTSQPQATTVRQILENMWQRGCSKH